MKFAEMTLREVFLDRQIHGGFTNMFKAASYDFMTSTFGLN